MYSPRLNRLLAKEMTRQEFFAFGLLALGSAFGFVEVIRQLTAPSQLARRATTDSNPSRLASIDSDLVAGTTLQRGAAAGVSPVAKDGTATTKEPIAGNDQPTSTQSAGPAAPVASDAPFLGAAFNTLSAAPVETPAGRPIGVHRTYWSANQVAASITQSASDVAAHRIPWVSYKLPDTWTNAKNGSCDAWAKDICAKLGALSGPVMLTWHHEPEGDDTPITDFVAMHTRLYQFSRPYTNIKCGPILSAYDEFYGPSQAPATYGSYALSNLFPSGFKAGDFIGFDQYNVYGTSRNGKWWYFGPEYLTKIAAYAKSQGVDWAIGEYGISHDAATYNRSLTGDVDWLREAYTSATSLGGCLALCYFDSNLNSITDWRLETDTGSPSKLNVFVDILKHSPVWRANW